MSECICLWFCLPGQTERPVKPSGHHEGCRPPASTSWAVEVLSHLLSGFVSFQLAHWVDLSIARWAIYLCLKAARASQQEQLSFVWHLCSPGCVTQEANANPPPLPFRSFAFYRSPHLLATWPIKFASSYAALQGTGHAIPPACPAQLSFFFYEPHCFFICIAQRTRCNL